MSDYHIIADAEISTYRDQNYEIWFGHDINERNNKSIEFLNKTKLSKSEKKSIIKYIDELLYPDGTGIIFDLIPPAFPHIKKFSTFRELKIGVVKELENSVLWKALQSLNSACQSYKFEYLYEIEDSLLSSVDYIRTFNHDLISTLKNIFFNILLHHISIQKILVTDANLWTSQSENLEELKYFRLFQKNMKGFDDNWIDIININHLDEYVRIITDYYFDYYKDKHAKRLK